MAISNRRYSTPIRFAGGYETGNAGDIAKRYGGIPTRTDLYGSTRTGPPSGSADDPMRYPDPNRIARWYGGTYDSGEPAGAAGDVGDTGSAGKSIIDTAPKASMPDAGTPPPAGNAAQRWAATKEEWAAQGGSQHTLNRANVARGIRPKIDGRATQSPRNSTASADIRAGWGWGAGSMDLPY